MTDTLPCWQCSDPIRVGRYGAWVHADLRTRDHRAMREHRYRPMVAYLHLMQPPCGECGGSLIDVHRAEGVEDSLRDSTT